MHIVHLTQAMVSTIVLFFFFPHYEIVLIVQKALCDLFHMYEKFKKELYVCISIPSLVVFFSNHKITLHTCIVWLY